jgi:hypothetical protein
MAGQNLQSELTRLLKEQSKARENEVFGSLSHAEHHEYDERAKRIHDVRIELQASRAGEQGRSSGMTAAEQRREWDKKSETDSPQRPISPMAAEKKIRRTPLLIR